MNKSRLSLTETILWFLLFGLSGSSILQTSATFFQIFYKDTFLISLFIVIPIAVYCLTQLINFMKVKKLSHRDQVILFIIGLGYPIISSILELKTSPFLYFLTNILIFILSFLYEKILSKFINFHMNIFNTFENLFKKLLSTIILYIIILLIFSAIYQLINLYEGNSFNGKISATIDYIYFSTVTMTTLGFGEITPLTNLAKIIVIFQSLIGIFMLSILIGLTINVSTKIDEKN